MMDFLAMDGYGVFIWSAYGLTVLGLGFLVINTVIKRQNAKARLKDLQVDQSDEGSP